MTPAASQTTIFFIDRCLGRKKLAQALRALNLTVEIHDDHFAKDALDIDWLPEVGCQGWIVLTKDERIGKRTIERLAVASANVKMFVLTSQNLSGADTISAFIKAMTAMKSFARENPSPFIAKIYRDGRVSAWKNYQTLQEELERS